MALEGPEREGCLGVRLTSRGQVVSIRRRVTPPSQVAPGEGGEGRSASRRTWEGGAGPGGLRDAAPRPASPRLAAGPDCEAGGAVRCPEGSGGARGPWDVVPRAAALSLSLCPAWRVRASRPFSPPRGSL